MRSRLREVVAAVPEVAGAYLFGSSLDFVRAGSDIDVGLILKPGSTPKAELDVLGRVEQRLGRLGPHPFHATVLRPEETSFTFSVLRDGELVYAGDRDRVTDVIEVVGRRHDDLAPFRRTFYRALGVAVQGANDQVRIGQRLRYAREQMTLLRPLATDTELRERRMRDPLSFGGTVRGLQTGVEAMIDVAFHLCAQVYATEPQNAADAFEILARRGDLPAGFLPRALEMVRLRNVVVHGYPHTTSDVIAQILREHLDDFAVWEQIVAEVVRCVEASAEGGQDQSPP